MPSYIKIVQVVEKVNSISRARLSLWRRPILCTTLYRNLMQASKFGGTFDQLFLRIFFMKFSQKMPLYCFYDGAKTVRNDQKLKSRGLRHHHRDFWWKSLFGIFLNFPLKRIFLWKPCENIQWRSRWYKLPSKLLGCIGFLYKVVHKTGRFSEFIFIIFFSF